MIRGLILGGAALGVPALVNAVVARRAARMPAPAWADVSRFHSSVGELSYRRCGGEGMPVLCLHSMGPGHSGLEWRSLAELLASQHRVFIPDLLGWGESERPRRTYDSHLYIDLIYELLEELVAERCVLLASGLTAAYTVQVAVDHPELVAAIGLFVPQGIELHGDEPDLKDTILHRLLRVPILGTSAVNLFTSRSGIASHLQSEVYADAGRLEPDTLDQHYRSSHLPGAHAPIAAHLSGYLNHNIGDILGRLEPPLWIAWGRDARTPAVESADLWLKQVPNAEFEVFERSALCPHSEQPEAVAQALEDFVARRAR